MHTGTMRVGTSLDLLARAQTTLLSACRATTPTDRYVDAHLGALRAAAALLATRPLERRRRTVRAVWDDLPAVAPEFADWCVYLAVCGRRRARIEAGDETPTTAEADELLRAAETFLGLVQAALGLPLESSYAALAPAGAS